MTASAAPAVPAVLAAPAAPAAPAAHAAHAAHAAQAAQATSLRHPALELVGRYRAVLAAAWQMRHELAGPRRLADEAAFLPAALSLQETPVHPAPRRAMVLIVALAVAALAWSWFGQLDIVAVADGRVVVSDRTKVIQPLETAVVKAIRVRDGDKVRAGQALVELDATVATADSRNVQEQLGAARAEAARARWLLQALDNTGPAAKSLAAPSAPSALARLDPPTRAEWEDIASRLARLDAELARRKAERATVSELIAKLEATVPLARQRETDFKSLSDQGFVAGHAGQDRTRERVELERDLAMQHARLRESDAALAEGRQTRIAALAETRRSLSDRLTKVLLEATQLEQQGNKAAQRERLTQLTAPVAGTVQQLAVHTPGGVVTPAQPLMVIVPEAAEVMAEVIVENKDIGFVRAGQAAAVKLEAFPFTRYGTVPAKVRSVSADAVLDEKRGAIFKATVLLERDTITIDGRQVKIAPGMNMSAEIMTGRRPVIEYLLGPVQRKVGESGRER